MRWSVWCWLAASLVSGPGWGAKPPADGGVAASPPNLERYSLVVLRRGPAWTPEATPGRGGSRCRR